MESDPNGPLTDMWLSHQAAFGLNNSGTFGDDIWTAHVLEAIAATSANSSSDKDNESKPLFAYLALGSSHTPLQAPESMLEPYDKNVRASYLFQLFQLFHLFQLVHPFCP